MRKAIFWLLLGCSAFAAPAFVQKTNFSKSSSGSASAPSINVTAGNLMVMGCNQFNATTSQFSGVPTDTLSSVWIQGPAMGVANANLYTFYALVPSTSANTVSINLTTTGGYVCSLEEYSGQTSGKTGYWSWTGGLKVSAKTVAAGNVTANASQLLIGYTADQTNTSGTWSATGWTQRDTLGTAAAGVIGELDDLGVSAGNYNASFTTNGSSTSLGLATVVLSFNSAAYTPTDEFIQGDARFNYGVGNIPSVKLPNNVASGDNIIVIAGCNGTSVSVSTPTDSLGTTYNSMLTQTSAGNGAQIVSFVGTTSSSGANTISAGNSGCTNRSGWMWVGEYSSRAFPSVGAVTTAGASSAISGTGTNSTGNVTVGSGQPMLAYGWRDLDLGLGSPTISSGTLRTRFEGASTSASGNTTPSAISVYDMDAASTTTFNVSFTTSNFAAIVSSNVNPVGGGGPCLFVICQQ